MIKKILLIIALLSTITIGARGDLTNYELLDQMDKNEINQFLAFALPFSTVPSTDYDLQLYSIEYETIDQFGNVAIASGAIVVPVNQLEVFPLFSFHHGTQIRRSGTYSQGGTLDLLTMWIGAGYIGIFPDYLGLGVSNVFHPYQINIPSATASIDILYAVKEFCDLNNINISQQLFLSGYSEGGYVTAAVQKMIEEEYSDVFNITASALCAGAYDMSETMFNLMIAEEEYGEPYYLPYIIFAYQDSYSILDDIGDYFIEEYSDTLQVLFNGEYGSGDINAVMPSVPIQIMKPELVEEVVNDINHPFRERLRENDLYDWSPQSPTQLIHSYQDELVPYQNSEVAYNSFINNGSDNVELSLLNVGAHQEAAPTILVGVYYWFEEFREENPFISGDMNLDFNLDILDVIIMSNIIIQEVTPTNSQIVLSDFNQDNITDIIDIIILIDLILNN